MLADREQHRREADAAVTAIRQQAQESRAVGLNQEQADGLLLEIRNRAKAIRSGWANPQYGTCIEDEMTHLLDAFEKLDDSLTAGFQPPSDWE